MGEWKQSLKKHFASKLHRNPNPLVEFCFLWDPDGILVGSQWIHKGCTWDPYGSICKPNGIDMDPYGSMWDWNQIYMWCMCGPWNSHEMSMHPYSDHVGSKWSHMGSICNPYWINMDPCGIEMKCIGVPYNSCGMHMDPYANCMGSKWIHMDPYGIEIKCICDACVVHRILMRYLWIHIVIMWDPNEATWDPYAIHMGSIWIHVASKWNAYVFHKFLKGSIWIHDGSTWNPYAIWMDRYGSMWDWNAFDVKSIWDPSDSYMVFMNPWRNPSQTQPELYTRIHGLAHRI